VSESSTYNIKMHKGNHSYVLKYYKDNLVVESTEVHINAMTLPVL